MLETLGKENVTIESLDTASGKQLALLEWKKGEELPQQIVKQPIEYLSYSQIETFMTCPLQYKYRYILKIPIPPTAAGSFGTSIHLTLQKFYEQARQGKKLSQENLLQIYEEVCCQLVMGQNNMRKK